jgi:hypothetical protein
MADDDMSIVPARYEELTMRRLTGRVTGLMFAMALFAAPASAQIVQSLHLGAGVFMPRGFASRAEGDVLVRDLDELTLVACTTRRVQSCLRREFTGGQVNGEWLIAFGDHLEFGAGAGFYQRTAPTVYTDYTHDETKNFSEIEQEIQLRIAPVTGMVRVLAGRPGSFQPYVGVGVSALNFRYTESGEFIDFDSLIRFNTFETFTDRYVAKGTVVAPVFAGGLRVPIAGDLWGFSAEWRYQAGVGKTGGLEHGFLDDKIDLGGSSLNFGLLIRY